MDHLLYVQIPGQKAEILTFTHQEKNHYEIPSKILLITIVWYPLNSIFILQLKTGYNVPSERTRLTKHVVVLEAGHIFRVTVKINNVQDLPEPSYPIP